MAVVPVSPWQRMTVPKIWQETVAWKSLWQNQRRRLFGEAAPGNLLHSLGIRLLVPYRDAPDKGG